MAETSDPAVVDINAGDDDLVRLTRSLDHDEDELWRRHRLVWWATLAGPVLLTLGALLFVMLVSGTEFTLRLITTALTGLFLFGRFIILAGHDPEVAAVTGRMTSIELFAMVTWLDLFVAVLLMFHAGFLFRLPWFGSRAGILVKDGRLLLRSQPWIRRATFAGLVLFVAIPLAAMGSVGGTIIGRMLGVDRLRIFLAILIGSLLGNGVMWIGSDLINRFVDKHHPVVRFGGVVLILLIVGAMELTFRHAKRTRETDRPESRDR